MLNYTYKCLLSNCKKYIINKYKKKSFYILHYQIFLIISLEFKYSIYYQTLKFLKLKLQYAI